MFNRFWFGIAAALAFASTGCEQKPAGKNRPGAGATLAASPATAPSQPDPPKDKPAPAKTDPPLLLLDDTAETKTEAGSGADNSRCQVCHLNLAPEELAMTHAKASIGCAKCHGASDAHIADESWASGGNGTAPDAIFPRTKINAFCLGCHPQDKIDAEVHKDVPANTDGKQVCTDCHGKHRLATRKCQWK